jgi:NADPH:quinone reductase-like Zn-dependent oxidoreductase
MRAAQFSQLGGPEVLEIVDLPDPHPGPGQIRIVVHAAPESHRKPRHNDTRHPHKPTELPPDNTPPTRRNARPN